MARVYRVWLAGVLVAGSFASPAVAQQDGVSVDPNSPTGKEYAIPLDSERRQADPSAGKTGSSSPDTTPLFGTGIVRGGGNHQSATGEPGGGASSSGTDRGATSGDRRSRSGDIDAKRKGSDKREGSSSAAAATREGRSAAATREARSSVAAATRSPGAPSGGLGTIATIGLLAAGALLIGGLGGVVLRRVRG